MRYLVVLLTLSLGFNYQTLASHSPGDGPDSFRPGISDTEKSLGDSIDSEVAEAKRLKAANHRSLISTELGIELYLTRYKRNLSKWLSDPSLSSADRMVIEDNANIVIETNAEMLLLLQSEPNLTYKEVKARVIVMLRRRWALSRKDHSFRVAVNDDRLLGKSGGNQQRIRDTFVNPKSTKADIDSAAYALYEDQELSTDLSKRRELEPVDMARTELRENPKNLFGKLADDYYDQLRRNDPGAADALDRTANDYEKARKEYDNFYRSNIEGKSQKEVSDAVWKELKRRSFEVRNLEDSLLKVKSSSALANGENLEDLARELYRSPGLFLSERGQRAMDQFSKSNPEEAKRLQEIVDKYQKDLDDLREFRRKNADALTGSDPKAREDALNELRARSKTARETEEKVKKSLEELAKAKNIVVGVGSHPGASTEIKSAIDRAKQDGQKKIDKVKKDLRSILEGPRR